MNNFITVTDGCREEIIRLGDLIKIYKGEGYYGTTIHYVFRRTPAIEDEWVEEYSDTYWRDMAFDNIRRLLDAGEGLNKPGMIKGDLLNHGKEKEEEKKSV